MSQLKIKDDNNSWISIPAGGVGVPSGGTQGQVLTKSSATDYATEWASHPYGSQINVSSGTHDLNDYKTAGVYYFSTGANLSNAPNSALDGWLTVYQSSQDGACKQVWQREGSNPKNFKDFYMRLYYESAWGDWFAITDANGVIRYKDFSLGISFSGGTAGTYAGTKDFDISLSGWTPIVICMYKAPSAGTILCYPMINISSNNARLAYGRWGTGAYNETVTVRVAYVKG